MTGFVCLTNVHEGTPVYLKASQVAAVWQVKNGARVELKAGSYVHVTEEVDAIVELLEVASRSDHSLSAKVVLSDSLTSAIAAQISSTLEAKAG